MSLWFYGVIILGAILGGLVLLILYSLMVMARRGDDSLDRLELEMFQPPPYPPLRISSEKSANLQVPTTSDLYHGGAT